MMLREAQWSGHAAICAILVVALPGVLPAQSAEEYEARREALRALLSPRGVAVFKAAEAPGETYGASPRQESNLFYLTGITQPRAILLLSKRGLPVPGKGGVAREFIFLDVASSRSGSEALTGEVAAKEDLLEVARPLEDFPGVFAAALTRADTLYFKAPKLRLDEPLTRELELIEAARMRQYPVVVADPTRLLGRLRVVKSQAEVELIRRAAELTCAAHVEAMRSVEPGMLEYEVAALAEYIFRRGGAEGSSFAPIIGSGPNSCRLHYGENKRQMESGDVVVVDIGASFRHYCADVTRTLPVSGRFSERQRAVYEVVLKAQEEAIAIIRPGVKFKDIHDKAAQVIGEGLVKLGLISQPKDYGRYFMHGTSHHLGLDVHDVGEEGVLQPGMVLTVEPGIYIPEENLGVRIEDDVLVTAQGHEVLSIGAPKSVEAVEALMLETGIGNVGRQSARVPNQ
ncbi:MAG: aminopeptidase P family protein [candidate division KSB1 bacterium]|nr:aminopeptidase P family protein [candidate division KSB1 bacterium]MDZ7385173.1 aminopeptidase P family protein [candidate division KSB1 bacterium]MDZ7392910.1 aminopeptidase P family protein [candidate division KSB1 bacterium]MDZ7413631.1 aminopeptidase P family protein [candidate division KSB1 bacterium]